MARMARESIFSSSPLRMGVRCSSNYTNYSLADSCLNSAILIIFNSWLVFFVCYFLPSPQNFGNGPGLRDAPAGREGSITVKNFAERAEAAGINLAAERLEETQRRFAVLVDAVVCECEGSEQPAPDRALMISGVAIAGAAAVMAGISRFARREAPQSMRG